MKRLSFPRLAATNILPNVATTPALVVRQAADGRVDITAWLEPKLLVQQMRSALNFQLYRTLRRAGIEPQPADERPPVVRG